MIKRFLAILLLVYMAGNCTKASHDIAMVPGQGGGAGAAVVAGSAAAGAFDLDPEFEAALVELDIDAIIAAHHIGGAPAPVAAAAPVPAVPGGIVGVFVPPVVPPAADIISRNQRAAAHRNAFPFAPIGRPFLANIQKSWLKYWNRLIQDRYPLGNVIPSFGWREQRRMGSTLGVCQMCGNPFIHVIVEMWHPDAPEAYRVVSVGVDCASFMRLSLEHVYQIAWENDRALP